MQTARSLGQGPGIEIGVRAQLRRRRIPSDLATRTDSEIEEERRLLYVAMTRAKDHLHLVVPQRFFAHQQRGGGDRHMYATCTRFIPLAIRGSFDSRAWRPARPTAATAAAARAPVDIGAKLRKMWR